VAADNDESAGHYQRSPSFARSTASSKTLAAISARTAGIHPRIERTLVGGRGKVQRAVAVPAPACRIVSMLLAAPHAGMIARPINSRAARRRRYTLPRPPTRVRSIRGVAAVRGTDRRKRFGERLSMRAKAGAFAIVAGALIIVGGHAWSAAWSISRTLGDALFPRRRLLVACFTVAMRQGTRSLHAAALVATGSLVIYLPVYLTFSNPPRAVAARRLCGQALSKALS